MNMRQFTNASEGYAESVNETWEQVRIIAFFSYSPHVKNGKNLKPTDLFRLPGDKKGKTVDKERREQLYKILDKWNK